MFYCNFDSEVEELRRFFRFNINSGSWGCLVGFNRLPDSVQSLLANYIYELKEAKEKSMRLY